MTTNGVRGNPKPFQTWFPDVQLTMTIASSVASSSETSLVGASGYKFNKEEQKKGKVKLKKPSALKRKNSDMNGMHND